MKTFLLLICLVTGGLLVPSVQAQEEPLEQVSMQEQAPAQVVNINTADAEELSSVLQGVGRARAEAIVQYREMYGPFESIEELMDVSGVGEATLARNREAITLE
ncbi:MAG: ComEA family DNA-binding protein [Chromatocurvus sp.]